MADNKTVNNSFEDAEELVEISEETSQVDSVPETSNNINGSMTSANRDNNPMFNSRKTNNNDFQRANNPALGQSKMNSDPNNNLPQEGLKDKNEPAKEGNQPSNVQNGNPNNINNPNNVNNPNNGKKQNTPNSTPNQNNNPLPGSLNNKKAPKDNAANKNSVKPKEDSNKKSNPKRNIQDLAKAGITGIKNLWTMLPVSAKIAVGATAVILAIIIMIAVVGVPPGTAIGRALMCAEDGSSSTYTGSEDTMEFLCKMADPLKSKSVYSVVTLCGYNIQDGVHNGRWHNGIDLATYGNANSPIYAAQKGVVTEVYNGCSRTVYNNGNDCVGCSCGGNMGNHIIIDHGGFTTTYMHLLTNSIEVSKGETVDKGQQIAKVGSTGNSTGEHLHFEIRIKSTNEVVTEVNDYFQDTNNFKQTCGSMWEGDSVESSTVYTSSSSSNTCCVGSTESNSLENYCPNGITVTGRDGGTYDLEEYVERVTTCENGGAHVEALKALSIAARTFALYETDNCKNPIENSTAKQVMSTDICREASDKVKEALKDIRGAVMLDEAGKLFSAQHSSFYGNCNDDTCTSTFYKVPSTKQETFTMPKSYLTTGPQDGHQNGLSQNGSNYMATEQGKKYDEILKFFYADDVEITESTNTCSVKGDSFDGKIYKYYQTDYDDVELCNSGVSIAHAGCGPTSMAVVASSLLGEKHDPIELSQLACKVGGCGAGGCGSIVFVEAAQKYGLNYKNLGINNPDEVLALLNRGDTMIIAAVRAGTIPFAITTGHFVVLYGTDGNGNVSVWDPYGYHNEAYNVNTKLWSFDEYFKPHTKDGKSLGAVGFYAFSKK